MNEIFGGKKSGEIKQKEMFLFVQNVVGCCVERKLVRVFLWEKKQ